jgi:hypothetical protein
VKVFLAGRAGRKKEGLLHQQQEKYVKLVVRVAANEFNPPFLVVDRHLRRPFRHFVWLVY